jgi:hypothetical protein
MNAAECQHIREIGLNTTYKDKVELCVSDLKDISHVKRKLNYQCISLSQAASENNAELIVSFEDGESYIYCS